MHLFLPFSQGLPFGKLNGGKAAAVGKNRRGGSASTGGDGGRSSRHVFRCVAIRSDSHAGCASNRECPCGEYCDRSRGACAAATCDELVGDCSIYGWAGGNVYYKSWGAGCGTRRLSLTSLSLSLSLQVPDHLPVQVRVVHAAGEHHAAGVRRGRASLPGGQPVGQGQRKGQGKGQREGEGKGKDG